MKSATNSGFTLVEVCCSLVFTGLLLGGLVWLYGNAAHEFKDSGIVVGSKVYPLCSSMKARNQAFSIHPQLVILSKNASMHICFGGGSGVGGIPPLRKDFDIHFFKDFRPLNHGKLKTTQELYEAISSIQGSFFETQYTSSDFTLLIFGRHWEDSAWVQSRRKIHTVGGKKYHLYEVKMASVKGDTKALEYAYAILEDEDPYEKVPPITRYFKGEQVSREIATRVSFPDPTLMSQVHTPGDQALSRFTYNFHGF